MKYFLISIFLLVAFLLQVVFFQMPFVLIGLLVLGIVFKEYWIFLAAFIAGILLDMVSFRVIGLSSFFFIGMLGFVFLYERKFEIQSFFFVGFASFFSLLFYFLLFGASFIVMQLGIGIALSIGTFGLFSHVFLRTLHTRAYTLQR